MKALVLSFAAGAALTALPASLGAAPMAAEMAACRGAVSAHLAHEGFHHMRVRHMAVRMGENTALVSGTAEAQGRHASRPFNFTCSVNPQTRAVQAMHVGIP
jgi:hypothetical protein